MKKTEISVVVTLHNAQSRLAEVYRRLTELMREYVAPYEIIFVDDGSSDGTVHSLRMLCEHDEHCRAIVFSKSFGRDLALAAGVNAASGDAVLLTDSVIEAPSETVLNMLDRWREGSRLVFAKRYGERADVSSSNEVKSSAVRLVNRVEEPRISPTGVSLILVDRQVIEETEGIPARGRFSVSKLSGVGFEQAVVEYVAESSSENRGTTLKERLRMGAGSFPSFSRLWLLILSLIGAVLTLTAVISVLRGIALSSDGDSQPLISSLLFLLDALIVLGAGIGGEHITRTLDELRGKPLYIVSERIGFDEINSKINSLNR